MSMYCKLVIVSLLLVLSFNVYADYLDPPGWENDLYFTHQSWDFNFIGDYLSSDQLNALMPIVADGDPNWVNEFGEPNMILFDNTHPFRDGWFFELSEIQSDRQGLCGGMGVTSLDYYVPGLPILSDWKTQVWLQMAFFGRKDGVQPYAVEIAHDPNFSDTVGINMISETVQDPNEIEGNTGKWYRMTGVYDITGFQEGFFVRVIAYNDPASGGSASVIDQVDIDTRVLNLSDLNGDSDIDFIDYAIFADKWGDQDVQADYDSSGLVDVNDLIIFSENWINTGSP